MPNSQLAEVAQAQHVREVERVSAVPLELVPVGRLLQGQGPAVPVLPEDNDEHVGIGASSWGAQDKGSGLSDSHTALLLWSHSWDPGRSQGCTWASSESSRPGIRSERAG